MGTISYKCPSCGAELRWDGRSETLTCDFCGSTFSPDDLAVENQIIDSHAGAQGEVRDDGGGLFSYTCPACGAELVTDGTTAADRCPYCDNNVVHSDRVSGDFLPEFVIPFKVTKKDAENAFREHYKKKLLVPGKFRSESRISEIKGVYVPFWLFSGDACGDVEFNAENSRTWTDGKYRITETDHYRLYRSGRLEYENVPFDGSSKADDVYMEAVEPFRYGEAVPFSPAYLSGFLADKYDVYHTFGAPRVRDRVENSLVSLIRGTVSGYDSVSPYTKNVSVRQYTPRYVMMPVWMLSTEFKGKIYRFAMNGQTGKFVGEAPVDPGKFAAWLLGLTAVFSAVFTAIYYFISM
ncbi:MAG: hypothetical protein II736_03275 [Clostridia bacterium]|nr:hypothetical protein [Clostridia bacterium]